MLRNLMIALPWGLVAGQIVLIFFLFRDQRSLVQDQRALIQDQQAMTAGYDDVSERLKNVELLISRVNAILSQAQQLAPGLAVGTQAPDFALTDLAGRERQLHEFLGNPFVLVFFSTTCGYCQDMAPRLGELPENATRMVLVSRGDVDEHLKLAAENKWRCDVLLESKNEVMTAYKASGTPTGYLIDADGRIASELAVGADALLTLVAAPDRSIKSDGDLTAEALHEKEEAAAERARAAGLSVTQSTIKRNGLPAGTPAPDFTLPDVKGQLHSLGEFRNKRLLLVFSDPNCGPCDSLAPDLVRLQQQHADNHLQVVMVSRGDAAANAAKARQLGFDFPVLLQRQWEVSKEYAMFATPIGYLINESGVIAKDVGVGRSGILALI